MIEFFGEKFEVPEKINHRRVLRLAKFASAGSDSSNLAAMGALDDLLTQCVRPEDAERFDALCDREGTTAADLMEFTGKVLAELSERPTALPAPSSAGPTPTPESSGSRLEALASERWSGRPDLQRAATQTG